MEVTHIITLISYGDDRPVGAVLFRETVEDIIMCLLLGRYAEKIEGVLSCYDLVIYGMLAVVGNAPGSTALGLSLDGQLPISVGSYQHPALGFPLARNPGSRLLRAEC
jgi:hypothetical protein